MFNFFRYKGVYQYTHL